MKSLFENRNNVAKVTKEKKQEESKNINGLKMEIPDGKDESSKKETDMDSLGKSFESMDAKQIHRAIEKVVSESEKKAFGLLSKAEKDSGSKGDYSKMSLESMREYSNLISRYEDTPNEALKSAWDNQIQDLAVDKISERIEKSQGYNGDYDSLNTLSVLVEMGLEAMSNELQDNLREKLSQKNKDSFIERIEKKGPLSPEQQQAYTKDFFYMSDTDKRYVGLINSEKKLQELQKKAENMGGDDLKSKAMTAWYKITRNKRSSAVGLENQLREEAREFGISEDEIDKLSQTIGPKANVLYY